MTRQERLNKLWNEYRSLEARRDRAEARRENTGYLSREMILVKAKIMKLELRDERNRSAA